MSPSNIKKILLAVPIALIFPVIARAHCPLCTAGAGFLAILAASLGVPSLVISTLLGGFALAFGLWLKKIIKKKYFRWQDLVVTWLVFFSTVLPLWPILKDYKALYLPFLGIDKYATTIPVDLYLVGVVLGAVILSISPYLSRGASRLFGRQIVPFQGIIITMLLLVAIPLLVDLFLLT